MNRLRHLVLYDGECSLCQFQVRQFTRLDWFKVLRFVPISDPAARAAAPHLSEEQLLEAIHCITNDGKIHRGARAFRFMGLRLPLLVPVALVMWIPGVMWVAEKIYQWISRNRLVLSRWFGCKEACSGLPAHRRDGDASLNR